MKIETVYHYPSMQEVKQVTYKGITMHADTVMDAIAKVLQFLADFEGAKRYHNTRII